ncbi:MAG: translation initiation factor [Campylobacterota bacterium]|nr:translation initiation factor [Campylobacterota bacterium]
MSRGKKLDIFIGADIDDSWNEVQSPRKSKVSNEILEPSKHFLFFKREKRRGKIVTLVGEFHMPKEDVTTTLKMLKKKLGCGGSYKDNFMEFQGELKDKLKELLLKDGFKFRQGH